MIVTRMRERTEPPAQPSRSPGLQAWDRARTDSIPLACAALILLSFLARLVLAWYSLGTTDAATWLKYARVIREHGLVDAYARLPSLNHPPLPALWSYAALRVAETTGASYEFVFKLPAILADAGTCALLARIWSERRGVRGGWLAALAYAWILDAILVSAFHHNTDNVYAFLCLLACRFADRRNWLGAGLALGAAINVKLIPVLLIPPLLTLCRGRRDAARFVAALAPGALPFVVMLLLAGPFFVRDVLAYAPYANRWSIGFVLHEIYAQTRFKTFALDAMRIYYDQGKTLILAAVALLSAFSLTRGRWDAYQLGAVTLAIFLILTPGFGVQYTVAVQPLLIATSLAIGALYGLLAGLFLFLVYLFTWTGTVPMLAYFEGAYPMPGALIGVLAWVVLVIFVVRTLARANVTSTDHPD